MASILKVDTLQKPDGSPPTAADLGLDVSGSVVGASFKEKITGRNALSATSHVPLGLEITYTPKFADSLLLVESVMHWDTDVDAANGMIFTIYRDGVNLAAGLAYGALAFEYFATGAGNDTYQRTPFAVQVTSGSTATTTFSVYGHKWNTGAINMFPHAGTSYIKVTEIAQ